MTAAPPPLPLPPLAYDRDADHLRILSICWYILAAFQGLIACLLLLYVAFGLCMAVFGVAAGAAAGHAAHDPSAGLIGLPAAGFGILFACFAGFLLLLLATFAFFNFKCGHSLMRRKNITLCYVMAAISCISFPVGTALGVFTFVVLSRPSVQQSFT